MLRPAFLQVLAVFFCSFAGTFAVSSSKRSAQPPSFPCQIEGERFDTAAFRRLRRVLTDTGKAALDFAEVLDTLGIAGVRIEDVMVVTDTVLCRRALDA
ncbi:hypothetical protein [Gemmatimonas phototrophica]|uniref:hypothetical protein n=1 Tax=Gemmatimonas phototrophica TaxID=1379270 RepID=UPI0011AE6331|nr:hypothetical protein [Gemmatimonas phototrophica]